MIICSNCGTENPATEIYCFACGTLLDLEITEGNTNMLEAEATGEIDPKRRWGTARFDDENVLLLTPRDDPANPLRIHLHNDMTLGRRHKDFIPDIDLSPFNAYDHGVSRQHAVLRRQNDTVIIVDLNSANNTFLNGQRLVPDQPRILRDGDEIRVGQLVLRVTFEDGF